MSEYGTIVTEIRRMKERGNMKLTELKCTACNGSLKLDENNPHIAVCEYCRTRYVLEDEGEGNVRLAGEPAKMNHTTIRPEPAKKTTGWEAYGWKRVASALAVLFLLVVVISGLAVNKVRNGKHAPASGNPPSATRYAGKGTGRDPEVTAGADRKEAQKEELTGIFGDMAATAFGKAADLLSDEELARFRWIEYKYSGDHIMVGYSFDDPMEKPEAALTWLEFDRDSAKINSKVLSRFTGLKSLSAAGYLSAGDIKGLDLKRLSCYGKSPGEVAALFEDPGQLKELRISAGLESLDGLGALTGVEKLALKGSDLTDIKPLAAMKGVKSLTLEYCNELKDFSVLSVMDWLEELSIESEGVRDAGFVKDMPKLTSFSLSRAKILDLDSLKGNTGLTSLSITRCSEVKDLSAVSGLTGLEELSLEVPYNCAQPDLSGLTGLRRLKVNGMDTVSYLSGMGGLEKLELEWVDIDSTAPFAGLANLKELTCSRIPDETKWDFVARIPSLEVLNLNGIRTYKDISGLFGMPALRELYLNGVECELYFSKISPNEHLEVLEMDGVKLYENVKISGGGGIVYVDYDKVDLNDNTGFLTAFPGIRRLSLADNMLTDISFAASLPNLEYLDISDNYVTDIKPLEGLGRLGTLDCSGNPVGNVRVLSDDVTILQ